ncbi:MAG: hypothetical protein DMD81_03895 [Candidatus Rokuibacteriota bacterium]|nr:MAG: hypothetical protein DMD81_03895 [Candidatus Rokubacteria bacterium]
MSSVPGANPAPAARLSLGRLSFLDGLRGIAIIQMVVNHTSRDWLERAMGWTRYYVAYGSVLFPATIFIFLVGFCLPISYRRAKARDSALVGAWKYLRRGAGIMAGGYLLNAMLALAPGPGGGFHVTMVFDDGPLWAGGVLQTIGLGVVVFGALLPLMTRVWGRWAMAAFGVLYYGAFEAMYPALIRWSAAHPVPAQILFFGFPPWPWLSAAAIGLVLGWRWLDARERGHAAEVRYFRVVALIGVACVVAYFAWQLARDVDADRMSRAAEIGIDAATIKTAEIRFGFRTDFLLNHKWTPRGMTAVLVAGVVGLLLAGTYYVMEIKNVSMPWLVVLGQTALMLYFVHQVIEATILGKFLGLRFTNWPLYWLTNVVFVVGLVYLGKAWLEVKRLTKFRAVGRATVPS